VDVAQVNHSAYPDLAGAELEVISCSSFELPPSEPLSVLFLFLVLGSTLYSSVSVSEEELLSLSLYYGAPLVALESPLLLLTVSGMHFLSCLLVFLQGWIMAMLGPRFLSSAHRCCHVSKDLQGIFYTCSNELILVEM